MFVFFLFVCFVCFAFYYDLQTCLDSVSERKPLLYFLKQSLVKEISANSCQYYVIFIKMKCSFCHESGTKKPPRYWLGALTTELRETLGEPDHLLSSYVTAGIGSVDSNVCLINNEDG